MAMFTDDVNAFFYNPALLNASMHQGLSVSYLNHLSDVNAGFAAYSRHYERLGTFAAGLRFLSWGNLQGADENGIETGTFRAGDWALTLGYARAENEQLRYGANVHVIYSSIDNYNASALATDLGVSYHIPAQLLTLSAAVNNLGITMNSLGDTDDELPLDVRIGVSKRLLYMPLLINVMGYNLHDIGNEPAGGSAMDNVFSHIALGGELQFSEAFNVRFGYNHRRHEALKTKSRLDFAGFSMGFGIRITRVRVDYAFNSWSSFGGLHQFTLRTKV